MEEARRVVVRGLPVRVRWEVLGKEGKGNTKGEEAYLYPHSVVCFASKPCSLSGNEPEAYSFVLSATASATPDSRSNSAPASTTPKSASATTTLHRLAHVSWAPFAAVAAGRDEEGEGGDFMSPADPAMVVWKKRARRRPTLWQKTRALAQPVHMRDPKSMEIGNFFML